MAINVLIIDDSPSYCKVLAHFFAELGMENVDYCHNGVQALKKLSESSNQYHILVVDLQMPKMDGIEFLSHLTRQGFQGGVIIASGMESKIIEAASQVVINGRLRLLGALMKPVCLNQLQICVERLLLMAPELSAEPSSMSLQGLRHSIIHRQVVPYYQPKVEIKTGKITGFEVLCRLEQGDDGELVLPERFIDLAEKNNLLNAVSEQLLGRVLKEWGELVSHPDCADANMAINMSLRQIAQQYWPNRLTELCQLSAFDMSKLTIEITESQPLNKQAHHANISRLRLQHFGVAIDDFGTGFTNLSSLCHLPITELKLDISLVKGIHFDPLAQTILKSLLDIGRHLGVVVVAEGVEDPKDLAFLENMPNLIIQGYLVCRPKPLNELVQWLDTRSQACVDHSEADLGTGRAL